MTDKVHKPITTPFNTLGIRFIAKASKTTSEAEVERVWTRNFGTTGHNPKTFSKSADHTQLPEKSAIKVKSYFGSTYPCESVFFIINIVKQKYRSRLSDANVSSSLNTAMTISNPDFHKIISEM
jgi:hypothetical protein